MTDLTPEREDPVLHQQLSTLTRFAPRAGFEDRVMQHVWRPAPAWIRRLRRWVSDALAPGRRWVWAGGLAAASAVSFIGVAVLVVTQWVQVETALSMFASRTLVPLWRTGVGAAVDVVVWGRGTAGAWGLDGRLVATLVFVNVVLCLICAWGLRWTMLQYRAERAGGYARVS